MTKPPLSVSYPTLPLLSDGPHEPRPYHIRPPTRPEQLLTAWLEMHGHAGVDPVKFRKAQSAFSNLYKRADYAEQGEYHYLLAANHKDAMS